MKKLTMAQAAKLVGAPPSQWHGRCSTVAAKLAPYFDGVTVHGHWLGEKKGFWAKRGDTPFAQHDWIVVPREGGRYTRDTETIVDPTRWSFEDAKPYIWIGKNDGMYDEGGNQWRRTMLSDPDGGGPDVTLKFTSDLVYERINDLLNDSLMIFDRGSPTLPQSMVMYIANLPPNELGWFIVAEIYEALDKAGYRASIPLDNWKMVDRRYGLNGRSA